MPTRPQRPTEPAALVDLAPAIDDVTSPKQAPAVAWFRVPWPVRTRQAHVPWSWVVLMSLPWGVNQYVENVSTTAILFKLRTFTDLPALLALVGSFNQVFNILIGASCNYLSDRIWTPWGRRRPFVMAGYTVVACGLILLPGINSLGLLLAALLLYEMLRDVGSPYEALGNEVVPPKQRGRFVMVNFWLRHLAGAFFFSVMIAQWDTKWNLPGGFVLKGEYLVFWTGSVLALLTVAGLWLGVKEEVPPGPPPARVALSRATVPNFFREVFGDKRWRPLYAIALAQALFWGCMGNLTPLLMTDQWGFSKQEFGLAMAVGTPLTLFVFLPLGGWLSDRVDRVEAFVWFALGLAAVQLVFFLIIKLHPAGTTPSLTLVIVYGLLPAALTAIGTVVCVPMIVDYVPRGYLGTVQAGVGLTRGIAAVIVANGAGLWVTGFSRIFNRGNNGYDYTSAYIYSIFCLLGATLLTLWFAKQVRAGRIVKLGLQEALASQVVPKPT